jgi:hypothetical protein
MVIKRDLKAVDLAGALVGNADIAPSEIRKYGCG